MMFMQRLLLMLAVLILGLAVVATRSTAQEPGAPWAPDCIECPGTTYGDPDSGGGSGGLDRDAHSYRSVRTAARPHLRLWSMNPLLMRLELISHMVQAFGRRGMD